MKLMKRIGLIALALCLVATGVIYAIANKTQDSFEASEADIAFLDSKYDGRVAYFGDLHDHTSDGDNIFADSATQAYAPEWIAKMDELDMDFQAVMNHHIAYHMYTDTWDNTRFIGGSEPATNILDSNATNKDMHYNMITPTPEALINVVSSIPKFGWTGGKDGVPMEEGTFGYPSFTRAEMQDLIQKVKDQGGLWVHVHPKQLMNSRDPLEYWFADYTGLEVFYVDYTNSESVQNYKLWTDLLAMGKRIWATAGCDLHALPTAKTLNVIYSEQKNNATYVSHLREGDFVCGSVGIRMAIGDATMGGHTDFNGKRVVFSVGDWHSSLDKSHTYTVDIISDNGVVYSKTLDPNTTNYFAFDADENASFYRVEIHDESAATTRIALGNPIWND